MQQPFFCNHLPLDLTLKKVSTRIIPRIILGICFLGIIFLFYAVAFTGQTDISETEMRSLQKVPSFTAEGFAAGTYQSELEDSIADQLRFGPEIKYVVKQVFNALTSAFSKTAARAVQQADPVETVVSEAIVSSADTSSPVIEAGDNLPLQPEKAEMPEKKIVPHYTYMEVVSGSLYKLDDSGYIIQKASPPEAYDFDLYDPDMLAAVTYPKYVFFIDTPLSTDFNAPGQSGAFDYVKEKMSGMTGYEQLTFSDFEDYKQYFYQTDHHWNFRGSYLGYTLIMKMLEGEDVKLVEPVGMHTYPAVYNGSLARDNLLRCANELFTVYEFNLPEYTTFVDDVEKEYGWRNWYVSDDDFPHNEYSNHYGMYYGDDHAKVVYCFDNPDAESILILATSWSNAVNELIASHYHETHVLDFRHYSSMYGEPIDAQKYMTEHGLSKLLVMGDISSLGHKRKN